MSSYRVGMVSLGCPKNQMDAELMLARLRDAGMEITAEAGLADVVISMPAARCVAGVCRRFWRRPGSWPTAG